MSGDVSSPHEMTVCECQHFRNVHDPVTGRCRGENCECRKFVEILFEESNIGKGLDAWMRGQLQHKKSSRRKK